VKALIALGTRFLIVGALSTLIEVGVFNLLYLMLGVDVVAAKVIASLVALINAYFGNREWTFRNRGQHGRKLEITLFIVVNAICTGLGAVLLAAGVWAAGIWLATEPGPVWINVINLASIGIVVAVRFLFYHYLVFRGSRTRPGQKAAAEDDSLVSIA
jgi:putative flippase GtrA